MGGAPHDAKAIDMEGFTMEGSVKENWCGFGEVGGESPEEG